MKRFFKQAGCRRTEAGWAVELDGRPVRTPGRRALCLPRQALAEALCAEWNAQGEKIDMRAMPLNRIANAAIDLVPDRRDEVIDQIVRYGATDLLCYRTAEQPELAARQQATWQPVLDWLMRQHDAPLAVTDAVTPVGQPEASLAAIRAALRPRDDFALAAISNLTAVLGSVALALAVVDRAVTSDAAWAASILDETHQARLWGEDAEAAGARAARRADFDVAVRMLALLAAADDD
ncbi:MAG: ATP12 family protein [Alphaproteobacteria bacterium]